MLMLTLVLKMKMKVKMKMSKGKTEIPLWRHVSPTGASQIACKVKILTSSAALAKINRGPC